MAAGNKIENEFLAENLLNQFSQFNEFYAWNKLPPNASGANVTNLANKVFSGVRSCEIAYLNTSPVEFNTGNSNLAFTPEESGLYAFRYSFYKNAPANITFDIKMFVDAVLIQTVTHDLSNTTGGVVEGRWKSYFATIYLTAGQVLDFSFVTQSNLTGGTRLYFDGLKISIDNKAINFENPHSEPLLKTYEKQTTGVTLPALSSGETYIVTANILGAEVGDYVELSVIPPSPVQADFTKLGFSHPYVYVFDGNNIRFAITNTNGHTFTPNAFTYKLKVKK